VIEDALTGRVRWQLWRSLSKRPWPRVAAEAGYDAVAWMAGLLVAARATDGPAWDRVTMAPFWYGAIGVCAIVTGCGLAAGLYRGRYLRGSRDEIIAVALAAALTAACLLVTGPVLTGGLGAWPERILGGAVLAGAAMLGARYAAFAARLRSCPSAPTAVRIIVFGAGDAGAQLIRRLALQSDAAYQPVAILDDDPAKRRLRILGVPVLGGRGQMAEAAARTGAQVLVIAIAGGSGKVIRDLTEEAERCGLVPKVIPSVRELLTGGARIEGVRDPRISDLLGRRVIPTDVTLVRESIAGQRVLVTGAGGSIGAELCRQLHRLGPAELIMLDRDESALHAVELSLHGHALLDSEETVLADIRDQRRVREVFARFRPDIVFHAAALKHLPLLESFPAEALKSNVWGTLTVLEAAAAQGVRVFVNISTDKAADPVSVLGCSKRITERLTAEMSARTGSAYLSVRFGNVLGSRGSVLTTLSAQAAAGGPLTVTDPEVRRYFMLADEAVHLVLQAAAIGRPGEVLVLDMGEPVRIVDIARRLTASTGREVDIVFTGLRAGEKLIEDRLGPGEIDKRPNHPLISQVPVPPLRTDLVTGLDPDVDAGSLRRALAGCARDGSGVATLTIPPQATAGPRAAREAGRRPAGRDVPPHGD
jgi:FlaA1/EpsC-like NDP-sugar epimerase